MTTLRQEIADARDAKQHGVSREMYEMVRHQSATRAALGDSQIAMELPHTVGMIMDAISLVWPEERLEVWSNREDK